MWKFLISVIALTAAALAQQHSYTAADIEAGARLYASACGSCHGAGGDNIPGVNFAKALFKTAKSDEDLNRIIRNGVPQGGMPPSSFSEMQAATIVAYLRSMTGPAVAVGGSDRANPSPAGDAERGRAIVEGKGNCLSCHRISGKGGQSAPDLTAVAAPGRGRPQGRVLMERLERALLEPSAEIPVEFRSYRVVTRDGRTITGRLLNQDTFTVQLRDSNERLASFSKSDLREFGFVSSPMPSYRDKLTAQELADVVSYLATLKGQANR